jgi:hypothetical protein
MTWIYTGDPWTDRAGEAFAGTIRDGRNRAIADVRWPVGQYTPDGEPDKGPADAAGRLMAAAPDLLAVCQLVAAGSAVGQPAVALARDVLARLNAPA